MIDGNKPIYKKWGFWAVIVGLIIIGYVGQDNEEAKVEINNAKPVSSEKPKIIDNTASGLDDDTKADEVIDLEIQEGIRRIEEYSREYLVGVIKNNTNKEYSRIQVKFGLYDIDGNKLGSIYDQIEDLEANGTWKFKLKLSGGESDAVNCKIKEIEIS